jgi:hypothetical protein
MTARRFVVGVDGSEESRAALRWSADEAVARGARLEVVCAWDLPFSGLATSYSPGPAGLPDPREVARRAESALEQTLREVLADDAPLDIERVVEAGPAARGAPPRPASRPVVGATSIASLSSRFCSFMTAWVSADSGRDGMVGAQACPGLAKGDPPLAGTVALSRNR